METITATGSRIRKNIPLDQATDRKQIVNSSPKILIISWGVYPQQAAMSVIIHNMAKGLLNDDVVVIGEKSEDSKDWDKVEYPLYHVTPDLFGIKKGRQKLKWLKFIPILMKVNRIIKKHGCTHILVPFPDEFFLSLAYFASKANGIPLYPWMHNTYLENAFGVRKKFAAYIQNKVFQHATVTFTISQALTDYYSKQYSGLSFDTLLHCFPIPETKEVTFYKPTKIKLALTGSFNASCSEATLRLCKVITSNDDFELHAFGNQMNGELKAHGIDMGKVKSYGFLSEIEFNKALSDCDVMLLPHGFDGMWSKIEYETIFPTRTIPLLYSGKPILLHSPEWAGLTMFFEKHQCGFVVSRADESLISQTIYNIFNDQSRYASIVKNAFKTAKMYDIKNVCDSLKIKLQGNKH
jgi:hypothetical protein